MLACPHGYLLIILIPEHKGKNQDMLYGVNVVMRHPKKVEFLNPAPDSFKQFGEKTNFPYFMKNSKFLSRLFILSFFRKKVLIFKNIVKIS